MKPAPTILALLLLLPTIPARAQVLADAYQDAAARELVERARERRGTFDRSIIEYRTRSTERISAEHRLVRRDRLLFRRETAALIHWRRNGDTEVEVIGAREVVPVAEGRLRVPARLADFMPHLVFDPLDSELLLRFDTTFIRHPLAAGSERDYRFAGGDSTVIRLPDGREVRLRELRFTPRRRDPHLIVGSFWLHAETFAVVQAAFRIARPYDLGGADGDDRGPFFMRNVRADIRHIAVEYGLWELRWWMPRYVAMEGVLELGALGTLPLTYQRSYTDYEITADTARLLPMPADSVRARCRPGRFVLAVAVGGDDTTRVRGTREELERRRLEPDSAFADCPGRTIVTLPDSVDLLASEALPGSIYGDAPVLSGPELEELAERVRSLPLPGGRGAVPRLDWGLGGGLARYNRVEGLALGARLGMDVGRARTSVEASYGFADEQVSAAAEVAVPWHTRELRVQGYRGLRSADPLLRPHALLPSLGAFVFGLDDTPFYRAVGGAIEIAPVPAQPQRWGVRLYGERQSPVRRNTDFSLAHLVDEDREFRDNIVADRAEQIGADVVLRLQGGQNPRRLRTGGQVDLRGESGDFTFVRPALTLRAALPPVAGVALALEAAAGTSAGEVPVQGRWFLGGTHSLRGYPAATLQGASFWRARAEAASAFPFVRLALFTDLGWAGAAHEDAWRASRPLQSLGAGVSLLDGIVRVDVARAVRPPTGWRLHLYLDGLL